MATDVGSLSIGQEFNDFESKSYLEQHSRRTKQIFYFQMLVSNDKSLKTNFSVGSTSTATIATIMPGPSYYTYI